MPQYQSPSLVYNNKFYECWAIYKEILSQETKATRRKTVTNTGLTCEAGDSILSNTETLNICQAVVVHAFNPST